MANNGNSSVTTTASKRRLTRWLFFVGLVLLATGAMTWRYLGSTLRAPGPLAESIAFDVPAGASQRQVLQLLQKSAVIQDARAAELALRSAGSAPVFKSGRYRIPARASLAAVEELLSSGQVELLSLTIPEGWTFAQARAVIERHPDVDATLRGKSAAAIMAALDLKGAAEGRFFPDTYRFSAGTRDLQIYRQANLKMQQVLDAAWAARAAGLPIANKEDALVLASIIEKETGTADERPLIAAVFVNRLRLGMRLQSDPTVIYGLGSSYDGNIRLEDLRTDTVYNTYTRAGLPPTPIALPGRAAIESALRPAVSDALFFVATGRGDGRHVFNKEYAAHQRAVNEMVRTQRAVSGSRTP